MDIEVTYIYHNCFVLCFGERAVVFDLPAAKFLNDKRLQIVNQKTDDKQLTVFVSHGHADHFNDNIYSLFATAKTTEFIISYDVFNNELGCPTYPNTLIVDPNAEYDIGWCQVETLPSNDAGVAFILYIDDEVIYYGGDLADWRWDTPNPDYETHTRLMFTDAITRLNLITQKQGRNILLAFSNADPRLSNHTGALEFVREVQPRYFVPMHLFGETDLLIDLFEPADISGTQIFRYNETGDRLSVKDTN